MRPLKKHWHRTKHRIDIYSFPNFLLQFFLKRPNLVALSPILVPPPFFCQFFFSVFAGYSGPLCLKPPGSGLPHNPALPDPPRLSYPSGGVRKSRTKKDIHPRGFGENSVTQLLNGLRVYPPTPPHPKSKPFTRILDFANFANFARFWPLHKKAELFCPSRVCRLQLAGPCKLECQKNLEAASSVICKFSDPPCKCFTFCYIIGCEFTCLVLCFVKCFVYRWFCSTHVLQDLAGKHSRTRDLSAFVLEKKNVITWGNVEGWRGTARAEFAHCTSLRSQ